MDRYDHVLVIAIGLIILDGLMTLPHMHLEGNPVVLTIGPAWMMTVKVIGCGLLAVIWIKTPVSDLWVGRQLLALICALHAGIIATNLMVLVGV